MNSLKIVLILITINSLRICDSYDLESLEAINKALIESPNPRKRARGDDTVCFPTIECFNRFGAMKHLGLLPDSPLKINTRFFAYNRFSKNEYELDPNVTKSLSVLTKNQTLVIIIHGFENDGKKPELISLKDSLLKYANIANVVMVDWSGGAQAPWYSQAAINTQVVGRQIAVLLNSIKKHRRIYPNSVHLIGYSLGAQVAHFAGQYFTKKYKRKIGRITALDAAAPHFQGFEGSHLTRNDANFVDAIHTSGGGNILLGELGFTAPIGHIDFYPNNGLRQPRCQSASLFRFCDHNSAILYMEASLRAHSNCSLIAYKCESWQQFSSGNCTERSGKAIMGYPSVSSKSRGKHYLKTSDTFPFCLGNKTTNKRVYPNIRT